MDITWPRVAFIAYGLFVLILLIVNPSMNEFDEMLVEMTVDDGVDTNSTMVVYVVDSEYYDGVTLGDVYHFTGEEVDSTKKVIIEKEDNALNIDMLTPDFVDFDII